MVQTEGKTGKDSLTSPSTTQASFQLDSRIGAYLVHQAPRLVRFPQHQNHVLLTTETDLQPRQSSEKPSLQGLKWNLHSLVSGTTERPPPGSLV